MRKFLLIATTVCMVFLVACGDTGVVGADTEHSESGILRGELVVSAFDSMLAGPFLEDAARRFSDIHPYVNITVETFSSMPEIRLEEDTQTQGSRGMITARTTGDPAQERRDYVSLINAQLATGGGPDILAMDVLPFHQYARDGRLANLHNFMAADPFFDINAYRANIVNALEIAGGLYMFPLSYSFEYASFNPEFFELFETEAAELRRGDVFTYAQLAELAEAAFHVANQTSDEPIAMFPTISMTGGGMRIMGAMNIPMLFRSQFLHNYNHFVNPDTRRANFTDGTFENLIETMIDFEERGFLIPLGFGSPQELIAGGGRQMVMPTIPQSVYNFSDSSQLLSEFYNLEGPAGIIGIGDSAQHEIAGLLANNQGEIPFTAGHALGINSNSQNQQLAWEFIKFVSSYAMVDSMLITGLPTYIRAFDERARVSVLGGNLMRGGGMMIVGRTTEGEDDASPFGRPETPEIDLATATFTPEQEAALQAYSATVAYFTRLLDTFQITDPLLDEVIFASVANVFNGSATPGSVAQSLQNQVHALLNE
ncbi:MAG: extracellular solute-binding protein [Defluviitaleaceae bacterium]|nr:extracellular solute-binding protein [Defluviitaleaceae bacterium]